MQAMHGRLGDPRDYQALQHFITHSPWEAARVWTQLRAVVPLRAGILGARRHRLPEAGHAVARRAAAVLRRAREDRQLPGRRVERVDRRWPHLAAGVRPVPAHARGRTMPRGAPPPASRRPSGFARSGASRWPRSAPSCRPALRSPAWSSMPTTARTPRFAPGSNGSASPMASPSAARRPSPSRTAGHPVRHRARRLGPRRRVGDRHLGDGHGGPAHGRRSARCACARRRAAATAGCSASARPTDDRKYYSAPSSGDHHRSSTWSRSRAAAGPSNSSTASSRTTSASITSKAAPIRAGRITSCSRPSRSRSCRSNGHAHRRPTAHAARRAWLGPRDHGPALRAPQPAAPPHARQLPPERAAPKVTKSVRQGRPSVRTRSAVQRTAYRNWSAAISFYVQAVT